MIKLDELDQSIIRALLTKPSSTDVELAKDFGVSRQTINKRRNSDVVQNELTMKLSIDSSRIEVTAAKAWSKLNALLDHEDPKIQLGAANAIMKVTADRFSTEAHPEEVELILDVTKYVPPDA